MRTDSWSNWSTVRVFPLFPPGLCSYSFAFESHYCTSTRVLEYTPGGSSGVFWSASFPGMAPMGFDLGMAYAFFLLEFVQSPVTNRVTNDHLVRVGILTGNAGQPSRSLTYSS